jgi:hypothetical protein
LIDLSWEGKLKEEGGASLQSLVSTEREDWREQLKGLIEDGKGCGIDVHRPLSRKWKEGKLLSKVQQL